MSSGTLLVDSGITLTIAGTYSATGGNINNQGTIKLSGGSASFPGTGATVNNGTANTMNNLEIAGSGTVTMTSTLIVSGTLTVTSGIFDQGASFDLTTGTISVGASGTLKNIGTGDLTIGAGGVSNAGTITLNGGTSSCGEADSILIRSSDNATQRSWSGTGTFDLTDVDVSRQGGTALITVKSGTNSGNNGANWTFLPACVGAGQTVYTWTQAVDSNWQNPLNWSPTRASAPNATTTDIIVFNGTNTQTTNVTNVPTQTIAALQVTNGAFVTLNPSATNTLTINGGATNAFSVDSGNALTLNGALTVSLTNNSTGTVAGFMTLQGGAPQLIAASGSTVTFSGSNALFTTATSYSSGSNPFGTGTGGNGSSNSIIFASGSVYEHNNGASPFGTTSNGVVVFQTGSEALYLTATGFDANGRTYANLVIGLPDPSGVAVAASGSNSGNFQFDNLTINGKDTSNNSSLTVTDSGGASTITIQGNITSNSGTNNTTNDVSLTAGSGGIILNNTATHTFGKSGNSHTITFGSNATVNSGASLTLQRNLIVTPTSSSVLSIRGSLSASANGYVIGNLLKPVSGDTTFEVGTANGYSPAALSSVTGSADFTILAVQSSMLSIDPNKALHRYWTLTNGGIASAVLTFHYLDIDVFGTEANYRIIKYTGTPPATFPEGTTDNVTESTNTAMTTVPMTSFSDWSVAEPASVTAVKMEGFNASGFNNGNLVKWQTGYEVDNLGFNVYRMSGGKLTRITPSIVAGSALMAGHTPLTAGLSYSWFDPKGLPDSEYYVEDIDLNGTRTMHGPIRTEFAGNTESPSKQQAALLSEISNMQTDTTRFVTGYPAAQAAATIEQQQATEPQTTTTPEATPQTEEQQPAAPVLKKGVIRKLYQLHEDGVPMVDLPSDESGSKPPATIIAPTTRNEQVNTGKNASTVGQRAIAAGQAVKIAVRKSGWYRVTQAELVTAGLDPNANPNFLQLYADGIEQAMLVRSSNSSQFSADGSIEFYGTGMDTLTSDTRTYWLIVGSQPGKRIDGQQSKSSSNTDVSSSQSTQGSSTSMTMELPTSAYSYTVERRDKIVYFNALLNGEADNFFGPVISKTAAKQDVTLNSIDTLTSGPATLDVALQGVTTQAHKVRVVINGIEVGVIDFNNVEHPVQQFQIPRSLLAEGNNSITLTSLNGDSDINLVDYVRLTYWRAYRADADALTFTTSHTTPFAVEGFTSPQVRVFNITNPDSVTQVNVKATQKGNTYSIKVPGSNGSARTLIALADSQVQHPASITANEPSNLSASDNRADFIILTHRNFLDAVKPLADLRRSQGLETMVVDVENVYDEFGYGAKSRQAIKDFLALAKNSWALAPRYVLFVGDASYDPRNYQGFGGQDLVPTKLVDATTLETSSDDALCDFDGDGIADMSVGRLPVQTAQQAQLVIGKIVNYSPGQTTNSALLVSDHLEGYDFEASSNALRTLLPQNLTVTMVNRGNNPTAQVKTDIINAINSGPLLVNYAGHGSTDVWTGASILSSSDAAALTNGNRLPFFASMTCLNGRFQDSNRVSLAEALMKADNGGAIAVWASSGLTVPDAQANMDQQLMRLLFDNGQSMTLGDAVRGAKQATNDMDVRRTWIFFGDPTMRIR
jgi:hypothetical protein